MSKVVGLHISDAEYAQWCEIAKKNGLSVTKWIRRCVAISAGVPETSQGRCCE